MAFDDVAGDGQTESGAAVAGRACLVEPGKPLEDPFAVFWADPLPVVAYSQLNMPLALGERHLYLFVGVPDSVLDHVSYGPGEVGGASTDRGG